MGLAALAADWLSAPSVIVGLAATAAVGLMMVGALNLISVGFAVLFVGADAYAYSRDRMTEAVILLLDAAARSGAIRDGIDPQDVLLAVAASTWSFAGDKDWKERAGRVLRLVMDGLRYQPR